MNISNIWNVNGAVSAVVAAAIVGVSGLALDRGHAVSSSTGIEDSIALAATDVLPHVAALPEIVVTGKRLAGAGGKAGA